MSELAKMLLRIKQRQPYQSEGEFFQRSGIPGYAADDGNVVLNPNPPEGVNMDAVRLNESGRVMMRSGDMPRPSYALTPEQEAAFSGYSPDPQDQRETIAARILSGDPSAGASTPEQQFYVEQLRDRLRAPQMQRGVAYEPQQNYLIRMLMGQ
jgi:hypothetical protein